MSFFSVHNLRAGYGKRTILSDVSFSLEQGRILGILGANGCGKTTLLKCICGILPHDGSCLLSGKRLEDLSPRQIATQCSYIPQRSGIGIDIPALDVVLMGFNPRLRLLEHPNEDMKSKARAVLAAVGLKEKEHENYLALSEGQKQLCILARTLVSDAGLLLLDEPESALDFRFRYKMLDILKSRVARGQEGTDGADGADGAVSAASAVITLHDGALALNYCDELLLLSDGTVLGTIRPKEDPLEKTESMLSQIYGNISLQACRGRDGREHIVMIKEEEP